MDVHSYNIRNVGGWVRIFVRKQFKDHASTFETGTQTTVDYESFTVLLSKRSFRH